MSEEISNLRGFQPLVKKLQENNKKVTEEELSSLFEEAFEQSEAVDVDEFSQLISENYGIDDVSQISETLSSIAENDGTGDSLTDSDFQIQAETEIKHNIKSSLDDEDTNAAIVSVLENLVASQEESFNAVKENNGVIAGLWDKFKNATGIGAGSDKTQAEIDTYKEQIEKVKNGELSLDKVYKNITGNKLDEKELNALKDGSVDYSRSDFIKTASKYQKGQKQAVNTISGVGSALAVTGLIASGIFTGGLSLVAAGAICIGAGTAAYMTPQVVDGLTEKDGYSGVEFAQDLATGVINSTVQTVTLGSAKGVSAAISNKISNQAVASFASAEAAAVGLGDGMTVGSYLADAATTRLDDLGLTQEDKEAYKKISNGEINKGDEGYEEALEKADKYYASISNNSDFSLKGLATTAGTATVASLAAGASAFGVQATMGSALANATVNSSASTQIASKVVTGGASGMVAGGSAAFAGGGTNYIISSVADGKELNFDEWLDASGENVATGAITGFATGVAFEAVQIKSGTPAPNEAVKTNKNQTDENGLKYTEYLDKNGKVIARDYNANDVSKFISENSAVSQDGAKNSLITSSNSNNARTVRVTYDYANKTVEGNGTTHQIDAVNAKAYQLDWYNNSTFLGQKSAVTINETAPQNNVTVVDEAGNITSEEVVALPENTTAESEDISFGNNDSKVAAKFSLKNQNTQNSADNSVVQTNSDVNIDGLLKEKIQNNRNYVDLSENEINSLTSEFNKGIKFINKRLSEHNIKLSEQAIVDMYDAGQSWNDPASMLTALTEKSSYGDVGRGYVLSQLVKNGIVSEDTMLDVTGAYTPTNAFKMSFNKNLAGYTDSDYFEEVLNASGLNEQQVAIAKEISDAISYGILSSDDTSSIDWKNLGDLTGAAADLAKSGMDISSILKYKDQFDYEKFVDNIGDGYKVSLIDGQNDAPVKLVAAKKVPSTDNSENQNLDVEKVVTMDTDGNITRSISFVDENESGEAYYQDSNSVTFLSKRKVEVNMGDYTETMNVLSSQLDIVNNENGEPEYVIYSKESPDLKGAWETTKYELAQYPESMDVLSAIKNGTITGGEKLSDVTSQNGRTTYQTNYEQNGNTTNRNYSQQVDDSGNVVSMDYRYQIKDSSGNSLLSVDRAWNKNQDGTTTTIVNGKTYTASFDDSTRTITVTQDDGTKTAYSINDKLTKELSSDYMLAVLLDEKVNKEDYITYVNTQEEQDAMWDMCKTMPADQLINLDKNIKDICVVEALSECNIASSNRHLNAYCDAPSIVHELGHSVDIQDDTLGKISKNEDLISTYNKEMQAFKTNYPELSQSVIEYFSQNGGGFMGGSDNTGLSEVVAETNMLLTTYGNLDDVTSARAEYLVKYFPETVAKAGNLLGYGNK